jgi:Arc/MetJ-type ribon-helix-helix transcriptional regulator
MVRKSITVKEEILQNLNIEKYRSFSDLVSVALKLLIEKEREESYKNAILEASQDKLYLEDMKMVEKDFAYSDFEKLN